jgi:redox-sensitive bicupin YhaK (pirin superfamily)
MAEDQGSRSSTTDSSSSNSSSSKLKIVVPPRERDLGGFTVRRILPHGRRRTVGPFIFFDHMGPADFPPGEGIDVRPHPHIGLATVTYLFEGSIHHRDSLGSDQLITPGAVNWMTAGRGIVHSERSPDDLRKKGARLEGIQCWVALPKEHEEVEPSFSHHPSETLPEFNVGEVKMKLLVGRAFGHDAKVPAHSDLFYLEAKFEEGLQFEWDGDLDRELGVYLAHGAIEVDGTELTPGSLAVVRFGESVEIRALEKSRVMLLGGSPLPEPREIWWNFVSSSINRIEQAKTEWTAGQFPKVPGDEREFIPLPQDTRPSGTIM